MDILFLLTPGFTDSARDSEGTRYYCPDCAFLEGVNVASLALMVHVSLLLAHAAVVDGVTFALAAGAAFTLFTRRATATQLLAMGALVGLARTLA